MKKNNIDKKIYLKSLSIIIVFLIILMQFNTVFATSVSSKDPMLIRKINTALKNIQGYLVKLATPAAGVAIATGVMVRKFSFGNEEKMIIGKKIIINAIICYIIIMSIDLIIKFLDAVIK